uniref:Sorting nexin 29 n=1 Tax=Gouania willdenowi TaxID=441366 RepID=A0A8C5GFE2_GOUWI
MNGPQQSDSKRQNLLERLLDAVKQCQIRFGGRKEIATDSDSRVICLCAQFETVLQHGLRKSKGLALTAAALKQAAGFSSRTEAELTFWFHVKEHLNRHELQRFYTLRHISSELGRGRAWLRCALNEHSLERYLQSLLADRTRLGTYYEDWAFILDEERSSMLPTMAAGLNSILFAINIDNIDLNGGVTRAAPSVSNLLKESTQGIGSLLKESTQGVSTLLREISTATAVVPGFSTRVGGASDPLPVLPRSTSADSGLRKERRRKKKITNIISFDDDLDGGAEDEEEGEDASQKMPEMRKCLTAPTQSSVEEGVDPLEPGFSHSPSHNGKTESGIMSWVGSPHASRTPPIAAPSLPNTKSVDNEEEEEEEEEEEMYKPGAQTPEERRRLSDQVVVGSLSSVSTWSPLQAMVENSNSNILIPLSPADPQPVSSVEDSAAFPVQCQSVENCESGRSELTFNMDPSPPTHSASLSFGPPTSALPESMTEVELRQVIIAMMNRKDELEEQNTSLRSLLDGEMEHSAGLRQGTDLLKKKLAELEERHSAKVQALARENEVLKVQLKKYVGAVQMLKREGSQGNDALSLLSSSEEQAPLPQNKFMGDIEELAASYERKLIEVAEMHGELIEFNQCLYRSLMVKDNLIVQMRQELIDLRGPVYIRILDNEWNVYRRYTEFRELHNLLRAKFPQVDTFNFPPKKAIGNKDAKFVEERRKQLQGYLRMVMNKLIQTLPEFASHPTKETLLSLLPFCQDSPQANDGVAQTPRSRTFSRFPRLGRSRNQEARPEPQSGDL